MSQHRALLFAMALCAGVPGAGEVKGQYLRKNAIVEAVNKTRDAVVTLKVTREPGHGKREIVGTGVVIDERGFAVTNYHVVEGATAIQATLANRTKVTATVHATSARNDLAILRLPVKGKVKALPVASGADLMVGETVIAVGNPFGFDNTVSTGIVSALGREITGPTDETMAGLIQHSASINPGNSGGPLLNVNGELIGINVALREGAQGISFAINAETVKEVLSCQLSAAKVAKVSHGLTVGEAVEGEGVDRQRVVVEKVRSAGERAGLRKGDVIVKVGDFDLRNRFDVERAFWGCKPGDTVRAVVVRDGRPTTSAITGGAEAE
ncbi:MAG: trypsin-like peptidase domain-containing protein [Gemmataceae bacterium]